MALRLPPLAPLRLFEAAGRHLSFKLAAEELGVTPSAVSHAIMTLEQWLGAELFERGPRGLSLTPEGLDYLPYVSDALSTIAAGTQRVPGRNGAREIRISCAPTLAARMLMPILGDFRRQHPGTAIAIDTSHRPLGFPADGIDLAIRMGRGPWPGLVSTHLLHEDLVPVCAPDYLSTLTDERGRIRWETATLLHVTSASEDWDAWLHFAGLAGLDTQKGLRFDEIHLAFEAAAAGLGVAIGRKPLVDRELREGTLVAASTHVARSTRSYWLVGPDSADARTQTGRLRRFLASEFERRASSAA